MWAYLEIASKTNSRMFPESDIDANCSFLSISLAIFRMPIFFLFTKVNTN